MTTYKLQFEGLGFSKDAAKALIEAGLDSLKLAVHHTPFLDRF
jgi:hypothetical protein